MKTITCDRCGEEIKLGVDDCREELALSSFVDKQGDYCDECRQIINKEILGILNSAAILKDNNRPENTLNKCCCPTQDHWLSAYHTIKAISDPCKDCGLKVKCPHDED